MTTLRTARRSLAALALGLAFAAPASGQASKEPPAKEPTDGFFDVPARDPSETAEAWGLPAYLVTSTLGAGAIFVACKSARR